MRVVAGEQPSSSHQAPIKPSSHLHVDTFTYVCQCGCIGIDRKWRLCTSDERALALTFLVRPGDEFTSPQPSATSPFVSTSGKPLRLACNTIWSTSFRLQIWSPSMNALIR